MTTTFKARYKNGKLEPLEPVELPDGTLLDVIPRLAPPENPGSGVPAEVARILDMAEIPVSEGGPSLTELLAEIARLPSDGEPEDDDRNVAMNHDHYLYGAPKRV